MPDITASEFSVSAAGEIRSISGTTVYSTLDLHKWLQLRSTGLTPAGDDDLSMLRKNPSELAGKRNTSRPAALTLLNGFDIDDAASHRFQFGSIEQDAGATLYTGVNTIGSGLAGRKHFVVQNGVKYNSGTKWWADGPVRALFKVKASGALIGAGTAMDSAQAGFVTVFSREWGYKFAHFDVDCSAGSEQVAALSLSEDANITTLTGNYTAGANTVTSTSPAFVVTLTSGDTTQSLGGVSKLYKGSISWTGSARLSDVVQALQWLSHEGSNGTIAGVEGWRYRKLHLDYSEVLEAPFGSFQGGKWFAARGWWVNPGSLNALDLKAYALVSHDGTDVSPPNLATVSVGNLIADGYDSVVVGKHNGTGDFDKVTGITATGTAAATTVTLSGAPASDVPAGAGFVRINSNPHSYTGISGVTISGLSPAVPAGGYSAAATWFPLIDTVADATTETSGTFNSAGAFTGYVVVRRGAGSGPIVEFATPFAVGIDGGSINVIRTADE